MTKYKYSRKEIAKEFNRITKDNIVETKIINLFSDLLATLSPEEESQKIMMEQVPKSSKEKEIDSKLCIAGDFVLLSYPPQYKCKNCGQTWFSGNPIPTCKMFKEFNTPTPSTNIKEIKKMNTHINTDLKLIENILLQVQNMENKVNEIIEVINSLNTIIKK
jgi:hypothetical protein